MQRLPPTLQETPAAGTMPMRLKLATRLAGLHPAIDAGRHAIVFTHVPKTAGTTLDEIMRAAIAACRKRGRRLRYPREGVPPRHERNQRLLNLDHLSDEQLATCDYLSGHFPFGIHRRLPRPCVYVTLLREPVARLLSNVRFGVDGHRWSRDASVEVLIKQGRLIDNLQTRLIAGVTDQNTPCTESTLLAAMENLRNSYAIVGVTEQFDQTVKALITLLGWPDIAYSDRRVSITPSDSELAAEVRHAAERYFSFDMELYAYARARPTPWSVGVLAGTATGNSRQDTVLLTSNIVSYNNRPITLMPAAAFDTQVCPAVRRRGGEVLFV